MRTVLKRFLREEAGNSMVEYAGLLGIVLAASIVVILGVGGWVGGFWSAACTMLNAVGMGGVGCSVG